MRAAALSIGIFMMTGVASAVPALLDSSVSVRPLSGLFGAIVAVSPGTAIGTALKTLRACLLLASNESKGVAVVKTRPASDGDVQADHQRASIVALEPGSYVVAATGLGTQPFVPRRLGPIPFF